MKRILAALLALSCIAQAEAYPIWSGGSASGGGSGTVTSVSAGLGQATAAGTCGSGTFTTSGTISGCIQPNIKTSTYSVANSDGSTLLVANSASAMSFNIPQATASGNFANGWCVNFVNENSGIVTLSPTTSTIYGAPTTLSQGGWASICSDGTNYGGTGYGGTGSGAPYQVAFQPGLLTAVVSTTGVYGKISKASTVNSIIASAISFTCAGNPTITMYECGTSTTCAAPTTIGSATVTTSGTAVVGTVSNAAITAGDYIGWAISAGTCTSLDISATAQVTTN